VLKLAPLNPTTILPLIGIVLPSNMGDEVEPLPPPGEPPEVADASKLGGWIWIVLFGLVMSFSIIANAYLCWCVAISQKKHNMVYAILVLVFLVNLADYGLMVFDFSLGLEHQYPHSTKACSAYQIVSKVNPVIQAVIMVVLAMYAAIHYSRGCGGSRISGKAIGGLMLSGLIFFYGVLAVPPGYLASIVNVEDKRYCEIVTSGNHQRDISIFYLTYSAILSYWLPLMVCIMPMIRLAKINRPDKYPEVAVVIATVSSFFIFYFMHGCVVLVRHYLDAVGIILDDHHQWMIKVTQSLLWLVAYFWHTTRPILAFMMDPDLRGRQGGCCASSHHTYSNDLEDERVIIKDGRDRQNNSEPQQVFLTTTQTGEEAIKAAPIKDCDDPHSALLV